ncbi:MAG: HAD-IC family P-type ATPase [Patescibacteria group bacterium]|nr:HAD-IC family P-type ATPase [Patescibacteria group bacterium]
MIARWHNLSIKEATKILGSDIKKGLTDNEALERQIEYGQNLLPKEQSAPKLRIFLEQFRSPLIYILLIAGIIVLVLGHKTDAIVIFGAVILNTVIGYIQEFKASRALSELKKAVKHKAKVLRGNNIKIIDTSDLVPGDIIILEAGDKVPADGRIIEVHQFKINEMALTGEWLPAKKDDKILSSDTTMADRDNMVYMGTIVEQGKARAMLTDIGATTELGKIATTVKETEEEATPYQKKLAHFSKIVSGIIIFVCLCIFIEGMVTGGEFVEMFTIAVAIAVAAIPEGLPVAMTVILALGMQRILKKKGLVRKLVAAETLGSTSVICTDKTATLTQGKIKVTEVLTSGQLFSSSSKTETNDLAYKIAALCNEAFIENIADPRKEWIVRGDPTGRAMILFGLKGGFSKEEIDQEFPKIDEMPFDNQRKFLATLHKENESNVLFVAGAPENLLEMSNLEIVDKQEWEKELVKMAGQGYRIIALAKKKTPKTKISDVTFKKLEIVALLGLSDPLRKEAKEAMKICRNAGMRTIIMTGDHKLTAKSVGKQLGFKIAKNNIIEGKEVDKLSEKELQGKLEDLQIYARVEPKHKMRIVKAWQDRGEVVAMTGDGINDAPALKKADIGVAIGSGTTVAKEISDLILLNDSFSIIVAAVEEGRAILSNIRRVITYLLSDSFTEVILIGGSMVIATIFNQPWFLPLTAVQVLWINLVEDGLPSLALAFESKEKGLMKRKPSKQGVPLLTKEMKVIIFAIGLITDLFLLGLFFWLCAYGTDVIYIRTMIFAALAVDSLFYVFSCKSLERNLWHINIFSNKVLLTGWVVGFIALFVALYVPFFNNLLRTIPLHFYDWWIVLGLGFLEIFLIEAVKHYFIVRHQT